MWKNRWYKVLSASATLYYQQNIYISRGLVESVLWNKFCAKKAKCPTKSRAKHIFKAFNVILSHWLRVRYTLQWCCYAESLGRSGRGGAFAKGLDERAYGTRSATLPQNVCAFSQCFHTVPQVQSRRDRQKTPVQALAGQSRSSPGSSVRWSQQQIRRLLRGQSACTGDCQPAAADRGLSSRGARGFQPIRPTRPIRLGLVRHLSNGGETERDNMHWCPLKRTLSWFSATPPRPDSTVCLHLTRWGVGPQKPSSSPPKCILNAMCRHGQIL